VLVTGWPKSARNQLRYEAGMSRVKRSVIIAGHKTSISLEDEFWNALKDIAAARHWTLSKLIASIYPDRPGGNLSSAIRIYILNYHRAGGRSQPHKEAASASVARDP
jgi:predicted DNA-binding ribbon-helix-helix protein